MPTVDPAIARALAEARAQAISEEHLNNVMGLRNGTFLLTILLCSSPTELHKLRLCPLLVVMLLPLSPVWSPLRHPGRTTLPPVRVPDMRPPVCPR